MLRTRLTSEFGLSAPIVCAGMAFVGTPRLAAAVSNAGGMGTLGTALMPPEALAAAIEATKSATAKPFGVNFIVPFASDAHVQVCAQARVPAVSFHWGLPKPEWVSALKQRGSKVWVQVGSTLAAHEAVSSGADAVIAQGLEAGGHNLGCAGTFVLLPAIVDAVAPTPVLCGGGVADGRGLAAALVLGAQAAWIGTRFLATVEAGAHEEYKRRILQAQVDDTSMQTMFGPEWPNVRARALRNAVVNEWAGREATIDHGAFRGQTIGTTVLGGQTYAMPKFSAALPTPDTTGDFEEMCMVAGESAALIHDVLPAGDVVAQMMRRAQAILCG